MSFQAVGALAKTGLSGLFAKMLPLSAIFCFFQRSLDFWEVSRKTGERSGPESKCALKIVRRLVDVQSRRTDLIRDDF